MKVGLLLAAGRSVRFGEADKLLAAFQGRPLVAYAAATLRAVSLGAVSLDQRLAVSASREVDRQLEGFSIIRNPRPEDGLGASLSLGAQAAMDMGATRLLVLLGDMPFVTQAHIGAVLERCTDDCASASSDASLDRRVVLPPACFPAAWLERLTALSGDKGARALLADLPEEALVTAPPDVLADIDTQAALERHGR